MTTTQQELRNAFWEQHPEFKRKGNQRQNSYPTDIRVAWCVFVEQLQRSGEITEALAERATL